LEFTLYIGSKKAKHAIEYTFSKYACTRLSRAKRDTIWTKHQEDQEVTQRCEELKVVQNYIKESTQHKIESKVHQVNKANANEHKGSLKYTCLMTYLILRIESKIKKTESHSPKETKVPTNKPNSPLFL
jgi:hypothetical protein